MNELRAEQKPHIHIHEAMGGCCHTLSEKFMVKCSGQGYNKLSWSRIWTTNISVIGHPTLPPEPNLPYVVTPSTFLYLDAWRLPNLLSSAGTWGENETGVQVPWRVGLLHNKDLLDHTAQVPGDWLCAEGQVQQGGASGGGAGQSAAPAHPPQGEADAGLPQAPRHRPGVHRAVS